MAQVSFEEFVSEAGVNLPKVLQDSDFLKDIAPCERKYCGLPCSDYWALHLWYPAADDNDKIMLNILCAAWPNKKNVSPQELVQLPDAILQNVWSLAVKYGLKLHGKQVNGQYDTGHLWWMRVKYNFTVNCTQIEKSQWQYKMSTYINENNVQTPASCAHLIEQYLNDEIVVNGSDLDCKQSISSTQSILPHNVTLNEYLKLKKIKAKSVGKFGCSMARLMCVMRLKPINKHNLNGSKYLLNHHTGQLIGNGLAELQNHMGYDDKYTNSKIMEIKDTLEMQAQIFAKQVSLNCSIELTNDNVIYWRPTQEIGNKLDELVNRTQSLLQIFWDFTKQYGESTWTDQESNVGYKSVSKTIWSKQLINPSSHEAKNIMPLLNDDSLLWPLMDDIISLIFDDTQKFQFTMSPFDRSLCFCYNTTASDASFFWWSLQQTIKSVSQWTNVQTCEWFIVLEYMNKLWFYKLFLNQFIDLYKKL